MGFLNAIRASVQHLTGMNDTAFQAELQLQQDKTQYLDTPDRECDYLLEINQVTQKAPKCVLEPVSPTDLKVQMFGFYKCVDFDKPALFVSAVNQGQSILIPSENKTKYLKFGDFFQKVEFSQVNLTGISLSRTHGLTDIKPGEAIMFVIHGEFTTFNPNVISLALFYDKKITDGTERQFKDVVNWVCQNHPVIT